MALEGMSQEEIEALAEMSKTLRDNPKTRAHFLRLAKHANPELSVPEVEMQDLMVTMAQKTDEKLREFEGKITVGESEKAAMVLYENLRDAGSIKSRNEFGDLVKYASENGFQTSEAGLKRAAAVRRQELEVAEPTPSNFTSVRTVREDKELMKNPRQWFDRQAETVMDEIISARSRH